MSSISELNLRTLKTGDRFRVTTEPWNPRHSGDTVNYTLTVVNEGKEPLCEISGPDGRGRLTKYAPVIVEGTGFRVTANQNPAQRGDWFFGRPYKEEAIMIDHGKLVVGGSFLVFEPGTYPVKRAELGRRCVGITVFDAQESAA